MKKKDQLIEEKDQETKKKVEKLEQEMKKKDQVIEEKDAKLVKLSLLSLKSEYPATSDWTTSGPHLSDCHLPAEVCQLDIQDALESFEKNCLSKEFWGAPFLTSTNIGVCHCEATAQRFVATLLESVIQGLGLHEYVVLAEHRTLVGNECDILLVYKPKYLPFAVIEVKKPCNSDNHRNKIWFGETDKSTGKTSNLVAGQILDAFTALQLYGFPRVCGMITSWNHWRLVGTFTDLERNDLDTGNVQELIEKIIEGKTFSIPMPFKSTETDNHPDKRLTQRSEKGSPVKQRAQLIGNKGNDGGRNIWGSNIVPSLESTVSNDEEEVFAQVKKSGTLIVSLVALFVTMAYKALLDYLKDNSLTTSLQPVTIRPNMPCRILRDKKPFFEFSTINFDSDQDIDWNNFNPNLQNLYVIHHLGMGEYGNCCLAVSKTGQSCCAVKFFHRATSDDGSAERECSNWNKVYENMKGFPKCRTMQVAEGNCLVMPYLHPISTEERQNLINDSTALLEALQAFSSSGFLHLDIKWSHLALWNGRIVFLDLGDIREESDEAKQKAWCEESFETLKRTATPTVANEIPVMNGTNAEI